MGKNNGGSQVKLSIDITCNRDIKSKSNSRIKASIMGRLIIAHMIHITPRIRAILIVRVTLRVMVRVIVRLIWNDIVILKE